MTERRVEPIAGLGPRLAGWFVDIVVAALVSLVLLALDLDAWPRGVTLGVLLTLNAVVLIAWKGGNLGNLALGTRVIGADDGARTGTGRATVRWIVVAVPIVAAGFAGWWWFAAVWTLAVFGPVAFTRRHQGLHDLVAGVVVVQRRHASDDWTVGALLRRVLR